MTSERVETVVKELIESYFQLKEIQNDAYAKMRWPKLIPLMRFKTESFVVPGYGRAAFINTKAMGFVRMLTCTLTPCEGASVPFLMIEVMEAKGRSTVCIGYYDCTANGADTSGYEAVSEKYASLEDYPEKPAWYIEKRAKGSVSKFVLDNGVDQLAELVREAVGAYLKRAASSEKVPQNLDGLKEFSEQIIVKGMPLTETFNKVLGKEGSDAFFRKVVIPAEQA